MKRLIVILFAAFVAFLPCTAKDKTRKEEERAALINAFNERNFDVMVVRSIPKTSGEAVEQYTGDGYVIRIRGDKASLFVPGVNKGGGMQFGGNAAGAGAAELVDASCVLKEHKGKYWTFVLTQTEVVPNVVTLKVNENGSVRISVDRMPMTRFSFYGDATLVNTTE